MTIRELWELAEEFGAEDYDIIVDGYDGRPAGQYGVDFEPDEKEVHI